MSYAGFLDRLRAKNYATMRTPTNVNVYGPNSFTCVPPSILSPPSNHCSDNSSSCCNNNNHHHHNHHSPHDDDTCSQTSDYHSDCHPEPPCHPEPACHPEPPCHPSPPYPCHPGGYGNDIPIGTIVFNYGTTLPCGWLRCNGNIISSVKYAALIQIIGTSMLPNIPPLYPGGYYMIKY